MMGIRMARALAYAVVWERGWIGSVERDWAGNWYVLAARTGKPDPKAHKLYSPEDWRRAREEEASR